MKDGIRIYSKSRQLRPDFINGLDEDYQTIRKMCKITVHRPAAAGWWLLRTRINYP